MHTGMNTLSSKVALGGGHAHGHVVAHDLHGHHGHRLALGGVDLAGHDGGAGLVFGDVISPRPSRGPEASQRTSLAIFIRSAARP